MKKMNEAVLRPAKETSLEEGERELQTEGKPLEEGKMDSPKEGEGAFLDEGQVPLEEMFERMESIIGKMEAGDVSLEESFCLYSEGMRLLKKCSETIDTVEKKVLVLDENGETHEF